MKEEITRYHVMSEYELKRYNGDEEFEHSNDKESCYASAKEQVAEHGRALYIVKLVATVHPVKQPFEVNVEEYEE